MRRKIPLETYSRRTMRLYSRRDNTRRVWVIAAVALAVVAGVWTAWALLTQPVVRTAEPTSPPSSATSVTAAVTTPTPVATPTALTATVRPIQIAPSQPPTITVIGVGDMLFDRNVKELINEEGGEAPLAEVAERLAAGDVTVGNLETTLAKGGTRNPVKEPKYAFRGHPSGIKGLKLAGFDAVSLANNHALDYGWDPLRDTLDALKDAGIGHAGAGENTDAAWEPATIETADGARVAYLAFTHIVPEGYLAQDDRPGVASGKTDMGRIKKAVRKAKKNHDYVIVSFHWGVEYEDDANSDQISKAHSVIDAGADMVLAHHPHVIQGVEFYKGRLIAYSLGDFVFDHYSRKTGESFILQAQLGPDGTPDARAIPVYLDEHGRPEYVTGSHATEILTRLKTISKEHGTSVKVKDAYARLLP